MFALGVKSLFTLAILFMGCLAIIASGGGGGGSDDENPASSTEIVGAWGNNLNQTLDLGALVFYSDGRYIQFSISKSRDNYGVEYGTYNHDNDTGALNLTVIVDENGEDGLADNGIPYDDTVFVDADTLTLTGAGDYIQMSRVSSPCFEIVGAWGEEELFSDHYGCLVFYSSGDYFIYDNNGPEYGTYTHDNENGVLSITVVSDQNGEYGLADNGTPDVPFPMFANGDELEFYKNGERNVSKRVGQRGADTNCPPAPPTPDEPTLTRSWYFGDSKIVFNEDETFENYSFVLGEYNLVETGTYVYNSATGSLVTTLELNYDGEWGLGEYPGDIQTYNVSSLTEEEMIISIGLVSITLSINRPNIPDGQIFDNFNDGELNLTLWNTQFMNEGTINEKNGVVNITVNQNQYADDLDINANGFSSIQADIMLSSTMGAEYCGVSLAWRPFGDALVELGIVSPGLPNRIFSTIQVEDHGVYEEFQEIQFDRFYTFKMTWDGRKVGLYIDGIFQDYYFPDPDSIVYPFTMGAGIEAYSYNSGYFDADIDNFLATP